MCLLILGFVLDAFSQFHASGKYEMPDYILEYIKLALQFAFGAGVFAAIREVTRKVKHEKTSQENLPVCKPSDSNELLSVPGRGSKKKESSRD